MSVLKSMRLETSDDSSFFYQAWVLSILSLVVASTGGLTSCLKGGVDDVKGVSLTKFEVTDVEGP